MGVDRRFPSVHTLTYTLIWTDHGSRALVTQTDIIPHIWAQERIKMTTNESEMRDTFTADDVRAILTDPICAGMGRFPAIVEDDLWLDANGRRIGEEGAATVVESVLEQFGEAFPGLQTPAARPYIRQAGCDPRAALRRLLTDLRDLAAEDKV
jgi:hypothetical protein